MDFVCCFCLLRHTELYAIASIRRPLMVSNIQHGIIYLLSVSALFCSALLAMVLRRGHRSQAKVSSARFCVVVW